MRFDVATSHIQTYGKIVNFSRSFDWSKRNRASNLPCTSAFLTTDLQNLVVHCASTIKHLGSSSCNQLSFASYRGPVSQPWYFLILCDPVRPRHFYVSCSESGDQKKLWTINCILRTTFQATYDLDHKALEKWAGDELITGI
jgi:hypothetical protein